MRVVLFLVLITSLRFTNAQFFFQEANSFLNKEVVFGTLDYQSLKDSPAELNNLIELISTTDLSDSTELSKKAFYINAYNLLVIKQITEYYPIKSPLEVEGFFKENTFNVAGVSLTLDQIEFEKLFDPYQDVRIHFALGCGARSCPFLNDVAFIPEKLDEQLDFRTQLILARPSYVYVEEEKQKVTLNKIFSWYKDQFLKKNTSLIEFLNKYYKSAIPTNYEVTFMEYDWSLNNR